MVQFFKYIASFLGLASLFCSCTKQTAESAQSFERPFPVEVAKVEERNVPVYIEAIGNVEPFSRVQVRPQVSGKVVDVYIRGGQDVKVGDILYQIDPVPYQIALEKARATLEKDLAQLDYARQRLERYERLAESNFVSKLSIEEYRSNVRTQKGQVMIDQAEVDLAEVNLSYTRVTAPIEGRISLTQVDVGNLVAVNDPNALTEILQITPIYIYFAIPQAQFQDLQSLLSEGKREFEAILPFGNEQVFKGEVVAIDNKLNQQTGTIQLRGVIPNREKILWPGEFVRVRVFVRTKNRVPVVPSEAIQIGQKGRFVYVLKPDMTVDLVYVKVGERVNERFVAIEEGLSPGMTVVTNGQLNLRPGVKVFIPEPPNQASSEEKR